MVHSIHNNTKEKGTENHGIKGKRRSICSKTGTGVYG